jgi:hypothetical protein
VSLARYSILVAVVVLMTLALAWAVASRELAARARWAVLLGAAIAVCNTLAAHALLRWSQGRPFAVFMRTVLGGMAARMALMLAALVAGVKALGLPQLPLAVALLSYFALFLAIEILNLSRPRAAGEPR